jgi:hypothetical protein
VRKAITQLIDVLREFCRVFGRRFTGAKVHTMFANELEDVRIASYSALLPVYCCGVLCAFEQVCETCGCETFIHS